MTEILSYLIKMLCLDNTLSTGGNKDRNGRENKRLHSKGYMSIRFWACRLYDFVRILTGNVSRSVPHTL